MPTIEYYFTLLSPWTYLAGLRLEEMAGRHGASIVYRPTDLAAVFAETGGLPLPKRHPVRQAYRLQELRRWSEVRDMPINIQPAHWPTDPMKASCAVIAMTEAGGNAGALAHAFLRACWAEEKDIAAESVIRECVAGVGENWEAIEDRLSGARIEFDKNTERAIEAGVFGAPFYIVEGECFWGQDRLELLDRHLGRL